MNENTDPPDTDTTFTLDELARWEETFENADTQPKPMRKDFDNE